MEIDSRFALGMAALGRPGYMTLGHASDFPEGRSIASMREQAHRVLDAAWDAGVRWVDCARSYGRSEEFLRSWLDLHPDRAAPLFISSKWGYRYVGEWKPEAPLHEVKDHGVEAFRAQLEETRSILGPHLQLYQIHSATPESGVLSDAAVTDAMTELRDSGVRVGVSVSGPKQSALIEQACSIERGGLPLFTSIQATWNLLEPSAGTNLLFAHRSGRTIVVKEALANGLLSPRGPHAVKGPLADVSARLGAPADRVALAAVLTQPFVNAVLSGAATEEQLASNLSAADLKLEPADLTRLTELRMSSLKYWTRRQELAWT